MSGVRFHVEDELCPVGAFVTLLAMVMAAGKIRTTYAGRILGMTCAVAADDSATLETLYATGPRFDDSIEYLNSMYEHILKLAAERLKTEPHFQQALPLNELPDSMTVGYSVEFEPQGWFDLAEAPSLDLSKVPEGYESTEPTAEPTADVAVMYYGAPVDATELSDIMARTGFSALAQSNVRYEIRRHIADAGGKNKPNPVHLNDASQRVSELNKIFDAEYTRLDLPPEQRLVAMLVNVVEPGEDDD